MLMQQALEIEKVLLRSLKELKVMDKEELVAHRYEKFKNMGEVSFLKNYIEVH